MKILGLDSSGLVASVAIVENDLLLAEYTTDYKKTHSQTLLPMLDELRNMIELDMNTVDAIAIASGVVLCICAIIAGAVCDAFTHNDTYTCLAFFVPIAAAVAIFVYFGIREDWYENRYKEIYHEAEPESKGFSDAISAIIFPLAVVIYLILGFVFDLWHPGWIIFPICGLIVSAVEAYEKLKARQ